MMMRTMTQRNNNSKAEEEDNDDDLDDEDKEAAAAAAAGEGEGKGGVNDRDDNDDEDDEDYLPYPIRYCTVCMQYHWIYNSYNISSNRKRRGKCSGITIIRMVPIGQNIIRRT